jgi:uncharacterized RDD family membrane protein YckC
MVIRDLSYPDTNSHPSSRPQATAQLPIAPVSDRFVAFILDFLITSPVVSFCVATFLRDLKTVLILNSDADEATVIWIFFILCIIGLSSLFQSVFLFFWQATPGQKFMQLAVVSYPHGVGEAQRLTFAQCLLRPIGWWVCAAMGGIPFLDIVGHPLRRGIHERMSDTLVVSKKDQPEDRPLAIETRYISSTLWIFYGFLFLIGMTFMAKTYKAALLQGLNGGTSVSQAFCPDIPLSKYKDQKRLDVAVALYLAEEVDNACVYTEAQKVIWTAEGETKALGELAMALVSEDDKEIADYHRKACTTSEKSEACAISKYLLSKDTGRGDLLRRAGLGLVSSRILLLSNSLGERNFVSAAGLIRDLDKETPLKAFLEKNRVKVAWALNAKVSEKNSRSPASNDEKEILKEFKERYKLP